jgi:hypothetical protein
MSITPEDTLVNRPTGLPIYKGVNQHTWQSCRAYKVNGSKNLVQLLDDSLSIMSGYSIDQHSLRHAGVGKNESRKFQRSTIDIAQRHSKSMKNGRQRIARGGTVPDVISSGPRCMGHLRCLRCTVCSHKGDDESQRLKEETFEINLLPWSRGFSGLWYDRCISDKNTETGVSIFVDAMKSTHSSSTLLPAPLILVISIISIRKSSSSMIVKL